MYQNEKYQKLKENYLKKMQRCFCFDGWNASERGIRN